MIMAMKGRTSNSESNRHALSKPVARHVLPASIASLIAPETEAASSIKNLIRTRSKSSDKRLGLSVVTLSLMRYLPNGHLRHGIDKPPNPKRGELICFAAFKGAKVVLTYYVMFCRGEEMRQKAV